MFQKYSLKVHFVSLLWKILTANKRFRFLNIQERAFDHFYKQKNPTFPTYKSPLSPTKHRPTTTFFHFKSLSFPPFFLHLSKAKKTFRTNGYLYMCFNFCYRISSLDFCSVRAKHADFCGLFYS